MSETVSPTRSDAPASREEADAWLRTRAERTVHAHLSTREDADFARSVKSMIDHTVHEYGGRFLFELIQNGYDEQDPEHTDGRIAIILDENELDHGVLYAANTGRGFTTSNVRAIANLGLSDKQVGEGIGNKGVGFKSVLQICDAPEIYSTLANGTPGFCFRFALPGDVPGLVDGDPTSARQVLDEMSLYSITVPVETTPDRVTALWRQGYTSVIRLPLRGDARAVVSERLSDLAGSTAPVLLFLRRIRQITLQQVHDDEIEESVLIRDSQRIPDLQDGPACELVSLGGGDRFLVFTRAVPREVAAAAVRAAVDSHQLDPRWQKSKSTVEVSIAVPYSAPVAAAGRFFTYLPLGAKAPSPFAGHLNAPFSTNLARTDIDETNPLNHLLLSAAAELCLDTAKVLTTWPVCPPEIVLDIVSWDPERVSFLTDQAAAEGQPLAKRPLVPTLTAGRWMPFEEAWRWPTPDADILTAARMTEACQIDFVPEFEPGRTRRLDQLLKALGLTADPSGEQLAAWTEVALEEMRAEQRPITEWDRAYADIARIFAGQSAVLRSRRILLTDDWELRPCASGGRTADSASSREATPFFPPARQPVDEEDEFDPEADLDLPKSLRDRLFYLHSGLTWYVNRQRTPARSFFQDGRLVRRFDTRSIFEHIRAVLAVSRSQAVSRDALRLVFSLSRSAVSTNVTLDELGVRIPTADGRWIPATEALFSAGWPGTRGDDLSLIADTPADRSEELSALSGRLVAAPSELPGASENVASWVDFLRRIGVRDVLPPRELSDARTLHGRSLVAQSLGNVPNLPASVVEQWRRRLPTKSRAVYPETPYRPMGSLYWLPGQADWDQLTDKVRQALCRQILLGLKEWDDEVLATTWERDRVGDRDRQHFATPLHAFLATVAWLPVLRPGQTREELVTPARCWTFSIRGDETPPRFATLLSKRLRDLLDDDPTAVRRLRRLGLGLWGAAEDSARLVRHLGELVAHNEVPDLYVAQFRNLYQRAWADCITRRDARPFPDDAASWLVVDVGGTTTAVPIGPVDEEAETRDVVVASADDERSLLRLLADFQRPVLTVSSGADQVTALLRERLGEQVMRASDIGLVVLVDGGLFTAAAATEAALLVEVLSALPLLVATLLEFRRGSFSHLGQRAFEDALDMLRRVRLVLADQIEVRIGDDTRPLPTRSQGVLSVPDPTAPALVAESGGHPLEWATVDALAEPLMYLIGRPELATEFRLAAARMHTADVPLDAIIPEDIASACEVSPEDVHTTTRRIESSMTPLLERLYPIVAHFAGLDAATPFNPETPGLTGESDTRDELGRLAAELPVDAAELLRLALDTVSIDDLRKKLDLPLEQFNATLDALNGRYRPIDYSEQLSDDFADHVRQTHDRILDRIRWARWERFVTFDPQPDWAEVRAASAFTPDPSWGLTRDHLSIEEMDERIESELARLLGARAPSEGVPLAPRAECAKVNADLITAAIARLTEVARAWLTVLELPVAAPWTDPDAAGRVVLDSLDQAGASDFAKLDIDKLIRWLRALELWPGDMPLSMDPETLGLSASDIEAQRSEEAQRLAEAARVRRTVYIDDRPFDLESGHAALREALERSLEATPGFLTTRNRFAPLQEVSRPPGGDRGSSGGSGGAPRQPRLSDAQRAAIGFTGEWLAYKWLERLHDGTFGPDCWVSAYRGLVFPGQGDDGLGWDFEVPSRRGTLLYEVKTSQGEGGQFELGETQVLAAQANARKGLWRLLIVTNALDDNRKIRMLRNPFDPSARGQYIFVGQGLRLRYAPE